MENEWKGCSYSTDPADGGITWWSMWRWNQKLHAAAFQAITKHFHRTFSSTFALFSWWKLDFTWDVPLLNWLRGAFVAQNATLEHTPQTRSSPAFEIHISFCYFISINYHLAPPPPDKTRRGIVYENCDLVRFSTTKKNNKVNIITWGNLKPGSTKRQSKPQILYELNMMVQ